MIESSDVVDSDPSPDADATAEIVESETPAEPREPMPPVRSRFMFVDIAALRAKQLRRGALARVTLPGYEAESDTVRSAPKLERIAMQEVEDGLIVYDYPGTNSVDDPEPAEKTS